MESLELRMFREVAIEKSITRAAQTMGYVQSNITAHIHNLEAELGAILFIRHSRGVTLTEEGETLLSYANQIIALLDNAKRQFYKTEPMIKIGATQTIAAHRLPLWLSAYKRSCPTTSFSVTTHLQAELIESVANGTLDCAFINTEFNNSKLTSAFLFHESLAFVIPKSLAPEEIALQSIIVSNALGCPYRNILENWVMKHSSQKPTIIEYDNLEGIIKAVSLGMGVSLLPISMIYDMHTHDFDTFMTNDIDDIKVQLIVPQNFEKPHVTQFVKIVKSNSA